MHGRCIIIQNFLLHLKNLKFHRAKALHLCKKEVILTGMLHSGGMKE